MLHYILQVVSFQLLFLIIYDIFLRKETFFNLNRAYLLGTALLSVVIPFIKIDQIKTVVSDDFVIHLPEIIIGDVTKKVSTLDPQIAMQAGINLEQESMSIWTIILVAGMGLATLILLIKLSKLLWLAHKYPKRWNGNLLIVNLLNSTRAFSFFHYIFLGEKLNPQERTSILEHEIVHVKQRHTLDLMFFEIFRIIFWFNPLVYMYQNRIATLHEYIADANAVKQHNKSDYYDSLLSQVFETQQFSFVNPFFKHSLIKKRILMLSKSKSKRINIIKYALLIPLVFTMLIYTSSYAQEQQDLVQDANTTELNQELSDEDLFNKYYDEIVKLYEVTGVKGEDFGRYILNRENYIAARDQFMKNKAFVTYLKDLGNSQSNGKITRTPFQNTASPITYKQYLEYKKTNEAKLEWEGIIKDGILRLVVDKVGSMTDEEQQKYEEKLKLIQQDDFFKGLLIVSVDGKTKMQVNEGAVADMSIEVKEDLSAEEKDSNIEVPFAIIDQAPTFSFCDSFESQEERKKCMSENVAKHVNKKFNTDLAKELGLVGRQRINVIFKINKEGFVTGVRARAPHPKLEEEAIRVINELPQFIAGKHKGKAVIVPYSLPIIFQVNADPKEETTTDNQEVPLKEALEEAVNEQELKEVPFGVVDEVPMYDSCVGLSDNEARKKCVSREVSSYVSRNFNMDLATNLGLKGRQQIIAMFRIDELGYVTNVVARASHPDLEKETIRVLKSLPRFTPGKHKGKPVIVPYSLPIIFQIAPKTNKDKKN
ncbi:M56 family metallopeptidase [uncultured Psychroserpens sp.]|uniref:M56 family metallopeptidase n=1 Tax=uncultured Psychroserpens sp. TaxID=255436 RepID=UPI0026226826|nr:M56 family metallopeptidase [uncultured Psychroserpens sp.]